MDPHLPFSQQDHLFISSTSTTPLRPSETGVDRAPRTAPWTARAAALRCTAEKAPEPEANSSDLDNSPDSEDLLGPLRRLSVAVGLGRSWGLVWWAGLVGGLVKKKEDALDRIHFF